jgi:hypothetical protein
MQIATSSLGLLTTNVAEGSNLYYTDARARSAISSTATGLTYTSGTGVFSLTGNYSIPLTASTTEWNDFYTTPSTRITAGTGLSWSGNTLNATTPFGNNWQISNGYLTPTTTITTLLNNGFVSQASSTVVGLLSSTNASSTQLTTAATTSLAVNEGNVGIGTAASSLYKLYSVGGNVAFQFAGGQSMVFNTGSIAASSNLYLDTSSTGDIFIRPGLSTSMVLKYGGNVGISSSTPATKLSVGGSTYITGGLGVGVLNTSSGSLQTSGSATIGTTLSVSGNTTLTQATTTSLAITGLTSALLKTNANGSVIPAIAGTDYIASVTGDWTGTFDGQEGSYYLNASNLTNFGTPFYNFFSATNTSALAEGSNLYYTDARVNSYIHASTTIPKLYTNNTWSGTNTFNNTLTLGSTAINSLLSTDSSGNITATSTPTFGSFNATSTTATSTIAGGLKITKGLDLGSGYIFGAGLTSCSGSADKLTWNSTTGQFDCGADAGAGGGITSLGAEYSTPSTDSGQTFATSSDSGLTLTILSSGDTHTFTPGVASGYNIPLTASTTNWSSFYDTPSTRITAGMNLAWNNNILNFSSTTLNLTTSAFASNNISQWNNDTGYTSYAFPFTTNTGYNSTSTTIGFTNGLFSTASSTFSSAFRLPSLSTGGLAVDSNGLVYSGATTTAGTGLTYSGNAFNVNTSQNITTLSNLTSNGVVYTAGGTGVLNTTGTSTPTIGSSLTYSGTIGQLLGGSSGTLSLNLANANTWTALQTFTNSSTTLASFTYASSTSGYFGNIGVGTTNTSSLVNIDTPISTGNALAVSIAGNSTFSIDKTGKLVFGNAFISYSTNSPINFGNNVGTADSSTPGYFLINPSSANTGNIFNVQKANSTKLLIDTNGLVAIGTTTPNYLLTIASATAPQLSLSAGAGISQWAFRNAGGNFYLGTTTVAGTATSSVSALSINSNGQVTIPNLAAAGFVKTDSNGTLSIDTTTYQPSGTYLTALGSGYSTTTDTAITFGTSTLSFNGLTVGQTIAPSSGALTFVPTITGTLNNAGLTNSTISGISLGGTLGSLSASDGALTFSGSYDGSIARTVGLNLANPNTWTVLQTFNYSSTTYASFTTASTTNLNLGGQTFTSLLGSGLTSSSNALTLDTTFLNNATNSYIHSSTTIPKTYSNNTWSGTNTFNGAVSAQGGLTVGTLNGPLHVNNGVIGATTSIGVLYGGTGSTSFAPNSIIVSNSSGDMLVATGTQLTVGNILATTTATSTFSGGIQTNLLNVTSTSASSTFANGINLTSGCYAVNGTCISGGGGGGDASIGGTLTGATAGSVLFAGSGTFAQDNANFFFDDSTNRLGLGTTTPSARLMLQGASGANIFQIATSSGTSVITVSEWGGFTQTISSTTAINIQRATGETVFSVDTTSTSDSGIDITADSGQTANLLNLYSSAGSFLSGFTASGGLLMQISSTTAINVTDSSGVSAFVVNSTGKSFGVGTSTLTYTMNVSGDSSASYIARINNSNTANTADGLLISLGVANASRGTGNYFIGFSDGAQTVAGKIQGGASAVAYTTTAADLAEYFRVSDENDRPKSGEIVMIDPNKEGEVTRADKNILENAEPLGIVSTNPGFVGNAPICKVGDEDCETEYMKYNVLVAIAGQVPLKFSMENGDIKPGDYLTLSPTKPGYAAKLVDSGYIVGIAAGYSTSTVEILDYNTAMSASSTDGVIIENSNGETTHTVTAFVRGGWRDVEVSDINGNLVSRATLKMLSYLKSIGLEISSNFVKVVELVADKMVAKRVETEKLCLDDVCITKAELQAMLINAGQSITQEIDNSGGTTNTGTTTPPTTDTSTSTPPTTGTSTPPTTDQTSTSTSPTTTDTEPTPAEETPVVEEEPAPAPEPTPEPAPEPTPEPTPTPDPVASSGE